VEKPDYSDWLNKRKEHRKLLNPENLVERIRRGDRVALAEGITLIESELEEDQEKGRRLVALCLPYSGQSIRIGITGVPGVGKSTFIESFGKQIVSSGKKLAVLAIDPSSGISGGSILGDKTRMQDLSVNPNVFIRPSPAGKSLGGVTKKTRESIFLCEAAGFDYIIVETVGVGQSETVVKSMVDFFLLLMLAGAGDELQGIKKGIMEMADAVVINKADGENLRVAERAAIEYKNALHLFHPNQNEWIPEVRLCSGLEGSGITDIYEMIVRFERNTKLKGWFDVNRNKQSSKWLIEALNEMILDSFYDDPDCASRLLSIKTKVLEGKLSPYAGAEELFAHYLKKRHEI
jgi:LAO/AO transport system kinase